MRLLWSLLATLVIIVTGCVSTTHQVNRRGNAAFAVQNFGAALQAYQQAGIQAPTSPELSYNAGNAHYRRREFSLAQEQYGQALLSADGELAVSSLFNLGNAFFNDFAFEKAIEMYKEVLRLNPDHADAKHNLELALGQLQRRARAQEQDQGQSNEPQDDPSQGESNDNQQRPREQQPDDSEQQEQEEDDDPGQSEIPQLTEDQARQILESVSQNTQTLRGHLQRVLIVQKEPPEQDW